MLGMLIWVTSSPRFFKQFSWLIYFRFWCPIYASFILRDSLCNTIIFWYITIWLKIPLTHCRVLLLILNWSLLLIIIKLLYIWILRSLTRSFLIIIFLSKWTGIINLQTNLWFESSSCSFCFWWHLVLNDVHHHSIASLVQRGVLVTIELLIYLLLLLSYAFSLITVIYRGIRWSVINSVCHVILVDILLKIFISNLKTLLFEDFIKFGWFIFLLKINNLFSCKTILLTWWYLSNKFFLLGTIY